MKEPIQIDLSQKLETIKNKQAILFSNETGFAPLTNTVNLLGLSGSSALKKVIQILDKKVGVAVCRLKKGNELKGVLIASGERSSAYSDFAEPDYGRPYRDFFYALHYKAMELCDEILEANDLVITHLTGGGRLTYYNDVAKTAVEALKHYRHLHPDSSMSITFGGCCIQEHHFENIEGFYDEVNETSHRLITSNRNKLSDEIMDVTIEYLNV